MHQKRCTLHCAGSSQLKEQLRADLQRSMELASEKDASNWLSALPLEKYSLLPIKAHFRMLLPLLWLDTKMSSYSLCLCTRFHY